jgi:hypothetical protein
MKRAERRRQWGQYISGWKASGLTQSDYCDREGISYDSFKRWRRLLGSDAVMQGSAPRLVPVRVAASPALRSTPTEPRLRTGRAGPSSGAEVRLSNGRAIALGRELDEVELGRLVRLLEVLPC